MENNTIEMETKQNTGMTTSRGQQTPNTRGLLKRLRIANEAEIASQQNNNNGEAISCYYKLTPCVVSENN